MSAERYYKSGYRPEIKHSSEARERLVKVDRRPRVMEEFSRLKVAFAPDRGSRCVHTVYCKPHAVRKDSLVTPSNRTLFSVGWPPYTNKEQIVELFSRVGHVSAVYLQGEPGPINDSEHGQPQTRTFQVAYIVFASPEELKSTDALYKSKKPIACSVEDIAVGLGRWCARYKSERPSRQLLETAVEEGVREYDRLKEDKKEVQEKLAQPDEEGWITVSRSNRKRRQVSAALTIIYHRAVGVTVEVVTALKTS